MVVTHGLGNRSFQHLPVPSYLGLCILLHTCTFKVALELPEDMDQIRGNAFLFLCCLSHFSSCDKIPNSHNSRKEGFLSAHSFRVQSLMVRKPEQREEPCASSLSVIQPSSLGHGVLTPTQQGLQQQ